MTDNKSFETVELFNPIELTPIDGIEMPKPVAMPDPVAEAKPVAEPKTVAVQKPAVEKEPVEVPEKEQKHWRDVLYQAARGVWRVHLSIKKVPRSFTSRVIMYNMTGAVLIRGGPLMPQISILSIFTRISMRKKENRKRTGRKKICS